ncbi:nucleoside triphosphate pyrophosphohydrolase [Leptospira fletcheri]|uniref:Nucleoside triphosphate pyrophosphohydrolase n=1 Tax=Leptospira fletcheri TaxID=2484981 RepID=A0A4R9GHQ6_9LEPT|nr:nucleoside triphosphate pyrophosphohydrolase [Leptospira fletcheri]TGK11533.1 nucleoside triphosphate pyrophosphohydrolase [Leptospira fletcheri]
MQAPNPKDYTDSLSYLRDITAKLRGPEGCPWDKEQTHQTLIPYILEESQEVVDALLKEDDEHSKEELGDLLFQIVLHAQIASERGAYTLEDIAKDVAEKLVLRHPHVFDPESSGFGSSNEVVANWELLKQKEKQTRGKKETESSSILKEVPESFPSLLKAEKYQKKAAKVGFDWKDMRGVEEKLKEELEEFLTEVKATPDVSANQVRIEEELGDFIFSIVNLARKLGISAESALTRTNRKFKRRIDFIQSELAKHGKIFAETPLEELDELWNAAKIPEKRTASDLMTEKQNLTSDAVRELSSYFLWKEKETSENDWPKEFSFHHKSEEYRIVFSGLGAITLLPAKDPWGRKGQPIFYLNLENKEPGNGTWTDLEGKSFLSSEEIHLGILSAIRSYKEIIK